MDPTRFDDVEVSQTWPMLRRCPKVVPGDSQAKDVFDYSAALSCHLPTAAAVSPLHSLPICGGWLLCKSPSDAASEHR
jgi:hypothetical protein